MQRVISLDPSLALWMTGVMVICYKGRLSHRILNLVEDDEQLYKEKSLISPPLEGLGGLVTPTY